MKRLGLGYYIMRLFKNVVKAVMLLSKSSVKIGMQLEIADIIVRNNYRRLR